MRLSAVRYPCQWSGGKERAFEVAFGNDANQPVILHHGQVADPPARHHFPGPFDTQLRVDRDDVGTHPVVDNKVFHGGAFLLRIAPAAREEEPVAVAEMGDPDSPTPEEVLLRKQTAARVQQALLALSPEAREVVVLNKFEGLRFAQIAEVLGCSVSAAKVRAFRALKALQATLHEKGPLC